MAKGGLEAFIALAESVFDHVLCGLWKHPECLKVGATDDNQCDDLGAGRW
jgi:hypothetical protein